MSKPGDVFKDCDVCPEMVVVPAGSFMMGSPPGEGDYDEQPLHNVTIAEPFAVGRYAVTFDEWDAAVAAGGVTEKPKDKKGWGRGKRPVININWKDATSYCAWLSKMTNKTYRLLSEAEWEYCCRAGTTTPFWWGASISTAQANAYDPDEKGEHRKCTVPVDSFEPNPWGLYQVHGNVKEWCADNWHPNYQGAPLDGSVWLGYDKSLRILRGGCWLSEPNHLRSANRARVHWGIRDKINGFRVARTL